MSDSFLQTALQFGKERDYEGLIQHTLIALDGERQTLFPQIANLIGHANDSIRNALFEALVEDAGTDTMFLLLQMFQVSHQLEATERRLELLALHTNPEVLELLEALEAILPSGSERGLKKTQNVLRQRFRTRYNMRMFPRLQDKALHELANGMVRTPHAEYLGLIQSLPADLAHTREALRVLRAQQPRAFARNLLPAVQRAVQRLRDLEVIAKLRLGPPTQIIEPVQLLKALVEHPGHPLSPSGLEQLLQNCRRQLNRIDPEPLVAPFALEPLLHTWARGLFAQILRGNESGLTAEQCEHEFAHRREEYRETLCLLLLNAARIGQETGDARIAEALMAILPEVEDTRLRLGIWILAGLADAASVQRLLKLLHKASDEAMTRDLMRALTEVQLATVPDDILMLALDGNRHELRLAALDFLAHFPDGHTHLEHLLAHAPLVVKEDVSATIVRHRLTVCVPALVGLLNGRITDSFRLIILATLEHFGKENVGYPIRAFLMSNHTLPVRLATLKTLLHAGGPLRYDLILETLGDDTGKRHRLEICSAFLDELLLLDPLQIEDTLLSQRSFLEECLQFNATPLRLSAIALLERFNWESEAREGWVGILQRALQTLVAVRDKDEVERLRKLLEKLSSRFESERKALALQRRLVTIANGLDNHLRLERIQALRQLDWIFRPEMIAGDPAGVKRLALRIERMLESDAGDTLIEVLAIEVAGKIGHPALHKKIREYLEHGEAEVVSAARKALELPINPILEASLIKSIFHIDDSGYITRLAKTILESAGFTAMSANDPEHAIEALRGNEFDLLLLDLNMPRMRGFDFLRHARRLGVAPRYTFVLTSVRNQEELMEVFREGVDGVLLKPFQAEDLIQKIREIRERLG